MERCAFSRFTLGPDPTAVVSHDPGTDGQTDTRPWIFVMVVQSLKDAKDALCIGRVKSDSIINN